MFHIVTHDYVVYEVWYQEDEHDYLWTFVEDYMSNEQAVNAIEAMEMYQNA